jgi:hypothetical protein
MDLEAATHAPHAVVRGFSRWMLIMAVALMAGAMLAQHVEAKRMPANGVSIAKRVGYQKSLCDVDGGTFESKETAFGSTITTCTGGEGAGTCVNTEQSTDCHPPLTRGDEDVYNPPTDGVFEEPAGPTPGSVEAGSTGVNGRMTKAQADDGAQHEDQHHGKGKKSKKGKGGKRGR